jgi:hypothetical protein
MFGNHYIISWMLILCEIIIKEMFFVEIWFTHNLEDCICKGGCENAHEFENETNYIKRLGTYLEPCVHKFSINCPCFFLLQTTFDPFLENLNATLTIVQITTME